jgi:tetraacyldisaccharide 4'-kinase
MRAPAFWAARTPSLAAQLLRPAAALYGAVAGWRMRRSGERAELPVICVGNFTVGGTGKTPAALALARLLAESGERPALLTRGYGGRLAGPVRVDPRTHGPADVGDEPLLLARVAPTVVSRDRPAGARACAEVGATAIVMDDGLQNPSLQKDLAFAVVDGAAGIGNGLCLPAGPLRAPLAAQWPLVDAVIVVGDGSAGDAMAREALAHGREVLRARLRPDVDAAARLHGLRVLAFAGIGRPEKFFETLEGCGATVVEKRSFADHHPYSTGEVRALSGEAHDKGLLPVTTEKDLVRIAALGAGLAEGIASLPVRLAFADEGALRALIFGVVPDGRKAEPGPTTQTPGAGVVDPGSPPLRGSGRNDGGG